MKPIYRAHTGCESDDPQPPNYYRKPKEEFVVGYSLNFVLGAVSVLVETNHHPMYRPTDVSFRKALFVVICLWQCAILSGNFGSSSSTPVERRAPRSFERSDELDVLQPVNVSFSVSS